MFIGRTVNKAKLTINTPVAVAVLKGDDDTKVRTGNWRVRDLEEGAKHDNQPSNNTNLGVETLHKRRSFVVGVVVQGGVLVVGVLVVGVLVVGVLVVGVLVKIGNAQKVDVIAVRIVVVLVVGVLVIGVVVVVINVVINFAIAVKIVVVDNIAVRIVVDHFIV